MKPGVKIKCEVCGEIISYLQLSRHLKKVHKFTQKKLEEYHFNYLRDESEGICCVDGCNKKSSICNQTKSLKIKYLRYCKKHRYCARLSPFTLEFWLHNGYSTEEGLQKIKEGYKDKSHLTIPKDRTATQLGYWIKKGYSEEDAREKLRERQQTFTKEKCIAKHGEEKGLIVWEKRQAKWQNTLNSKSPEEKAKLQEGRMKGLIKAASSSYSIISQKLFAILYKKLKSKYSDIYFATSKENSENNEMVVPDSGQKFMLLDFYIPSIKKCIEFDGDYWHKGKDETFRDERLKELIDGIQILHIKECEYEKNPKAVIQRCLEFLNESK